MSISARTIDTNYPPLMLLFLYLWAGRCICESVVLQLASFITPVCICSAYSRNTPHRPQHSTENYNYSRSFISLCTIFPGSHIGHVTREAA